MTTYALITGASKGIGKAMAISLAKRNYNLLLVARSAAELQQVADELSQQYNVKVAFLPTDLTEENAAQKVFDWCVANNYPVSVLINNAGYGLIGRFDALELPKQTNMMQLNMLVLVQLTHLFIPLLKIQADSYILNVASTAAYQAFPNFSLYSATKAFVVSFSRGIRSELKDQNISVSCVSPGPVDTNFFNRAGLEAVKATLDKLKMHPDEVAEIAIQGMFDRRAEIIPGFLNFISAASNRILPKSLVEKLTLRIFNQK